MKKLLALLLVAVFSVTLLCGCEGTNAGISETQPATETVPATTAVPVDYMSVYSEVLDSVYNLIATDDEVAASSGQAGILEAVAGLNKEESLSVVGYTFKDITGDGFSELLIGAVTESEASYFEEPDLFAAYTIAHDMPWLLFEGWARSSYHLLDDGTFLYEGSGGAAYSEVGNYRMSQGGTSLICNEYYFTEPNEEDESIIEIYYNTSGKNNKEKSEKLDMTADELGTIRTDWESKIATIDFTAFSQYK